MKDTDYSPRGKSLAVLGAGPSALDAIAQIEAGTDVLALSYAALLPVPIAAAFFEFAPAVQRDNQARLFDLLRSSTLTDVVADHRKKTRYFYKSHIFSDTLSLLGSSGVSTVPALIIPPLPLPVVERINGLLTALGLHGRYLVQLDGLGSLSSAIGFARWFGYDEVLLGGIDISTRRYFFDADEFAHFGLSNPFALEGAQNLELPHPTSTGALSSFVERLLAISDGMRIVCLLADTPLGREFDRQQQEGRSI